MSFMLLESAKAESYNQLLRLGSRSRRCARDMVAEGPKQLCVVRPDYAGNVNRQHLGNAFKWKESKKSAMEIANTTDSEQISRATPSLR
ncbi:unnamed protein product [Haemonchus placei]|uniref:Uncharacterized protein n=1 Tax=Haemonchus placei TaxID=6290 RepID=A0A0N4XAV9_HAEPC|nr:unnamed protein product [Haemonchus placei]